MSACVCVCACVYVCARARGVRPLAAISMSFFCIIEILSESRSSSANLDSSFVVMSFSISSRRISPLQNSFSPV